MSLWTPSGEHPVDRPRPPGPGNGPPPSGRAPGSATDAGAGTQLPEDLSPDERAHAEELARQIDEARRRLLEAPAGTVVAQQALQFYELAALHLSQPDPRLADARLAIDAFAGVIDAVGPRLAEAEGTLREALHQIRMAFVEVSQASGAAPSS